MLEITVNNGRKIRLSLDACGLLVEHITEKGEVDRRDRYTEGDLVTLLNWANYQRENGNPHLLF